MVKVTETQFRTVAFLFENFDFGDFSYISQDRASAKLGISPDPPSDRFVLIFFVTNIYFHAARAEYAS